MLNKINVNNIDTFILTNGPGSFTGIRVGISTVYGLSISQKSKIIGVSTLYAMIKQYDDIIYKGYFFISIIKANNTKIFNSIYFKNQNGNLDVIYNDRIVELNDVINEFYNKSCIILGYSYDFPKNFFKKFFQNFYFYKLDNTSNAYSLIKIIKENTNLINNKINNTLVEANYLMKFLS